MANETIMLSTKFNPKKQVYPALVSEKLDGVPAKLMWDGKEWTATSRQGKFVQCQHIIDELNDLKYFPGEPVHMIGELYIPTMPFKYINGLARRETPDNETRELVLYLYDWYYPHRPKQQYEDRRSLMVEFAPYSDTVRMIPTWFAASENAIEVAKKDICESPISETGVEGYVVRQCQGPDSLWRPAWRSPGMAKDKLVEDIDLPIARLEEAVDKHGNLKGMVGRVVVVYNDREIGAGPGKLSHLERTEMWINRDSYIGKMVEIHYMPGGGYDALREARVHRLRPDKD